MKKLGFGFMRLPLKNPDEPTSINYDELEKLVDYYIKHGFNYFDTAHMYHKGLSEEALRKTVIERYPRDEFIIADKLPIFNITEEKQMEEIFNQQLERLGVDYINYYMIHNASTKHQAKIDKFHAYDFLKKMKSEGKIKHIGISCHDTPEFIEKTSFS